MAEISRPWNGTVTGDAGPYSDANWQQLYRAIIGYGAARNNNGVFLMSGTEPDDGLKVTANSPATTSINVLAGAALVQGIAYFNTTTQVLTPAANASGNSRIDTIILRADYALQTIRLAILQGTPAASPVAPTLTQSAGVMWEIPIADILLATGFTSIAQSVISPRQDWVNAPPAVYLDHVLNNSGGTLNDGDVVIYDTTADRAATTTTTLENPLVLGVWRGQTANGAYGRVQTQGIGYIKTAAAVTRGNPLSTSTTVKAADFVSARPYAQIARALETTSGAGLCLANIGAIIGRSLQFVATADKAVTNTTELTLFGTGVGSLTIPANTLIAGSVIEIHLRGVLSTFTSGTVTIRAKIGGVTVAASAAATPTASIVTREIDIRVLISVRAGGSGGSVIANGEAVWNNGALTLQRLEIATAGAQAVALNAAVAVDVTWQWSVNNAANTVTINESFVRTGNAVT